MNPQKPGLVMPALFGAVFLGVTSAFPIVQFVNCACCALVIGGGMIAAYLYIRDYPQQLGPISYGDIALLGILTGVIGAFIWTAVDIPLNLLKLQFTSGLGGLEEVLDDPSIPPAAREFMKEFLIEGGFSLAMALFSFLVNVLISVIFATIGSIIGLALFQKQSTPNYTPPPQTPPAPQA